MHKLIVVLISVLLITFAAPAWAQQPTPTPAPFSSQELRLLDEVTRRWEAMSASDTTTTNASVLMLGVMNLLIFGGGILFVWRGGLKPLYNTMESDRKRADKAEQNEDDAKKAADQTRLQIAQTLERAANTLAKLSTSQDDDNRTNAAKTEIIQKVNEHTTQAFNEAQKPLNEAAKHVEEAAKTVADVVTRGHLTNELAPILIELKEINAKLNRAGTGELDPTRLPSPDPVPVPPTEGDASSSTLPTAAGLPRN